MTEEEATPRPRPPFKPADHPQQPFEEALALLANELQVAPAPWQPDLVAAGHQLEREQHCNGFEHVCDAAGRQGQGRRAKQRLRTGRRSSSP
jgi:hypothetical protein